MNQEKNQLKNIAPAILVFLFLISPVLTFHLSPNEYEGGRSRDTAQRSLRNRSAAAVILGEIRSSMSDIMFIKTEIYLHSGVAYKLNIDYNALSSKGSLEDKGTGQQPPAPPQNEQHPEDKLSHAPEEHEDHEHDHVHPPGQDHIHFKCEGADTVIPTREKDFRGFIGDLHRKVKPWIDPSKPHLHTSGTELLPWYRLMTISNPQNVRGYMIGAWWLKHIGKKPQLLEAKKFLEEGIENNPDAFQLWLMHGHIMHALEKDREAKKSYDIAADLAIQKRPPGGEISEQWNDYQEDDALAAVRLSFFLEKELEGPEKALNLAKYYLEKIGKDVILERQIDLLENETTP